MMRRFRDLKSRTEASRAAAPAAEAFGREVIEHQERAVDEFPGLATASGLHPWRPGDPIPGNGRRVLVGVGSWSGYDLLLLDALADVVRSGKTGGDRVDVFQFWQDCSTQEQLDQFIPGMQIQSIFHSPVVGVWEDGMLKQTASGAEGRDLMTKLYGLSVSPG